MLCPASSNKFPTAIHRVYLFFSDVASLMLHFLFLPVQIENLNI